MGGLAGTAGEAGPVAQIALQKQIDGFLQRAVGFAQIAGQAGSELGPPMGLHQYQAIKLDANGFMRGNLAIGKQQTAGRNTDIFPESAGDGIEDGLAEGAALSEIPEGLVQAAQIVGVGVRPEASVGRTLLARQPEVVERQDARSGQMVAEPAREGAFAATAGAANADNERANRGGGFVGQPGADLLEAAEAGGIHMLGA